MWLCFLALISGVMEESDLCEILSTAAKQEKGNFAISWALSKPQNGFPGHEASLVGELH